MRTTESEDDEDEANLHGIVFHEGYRLTVVLEADGCLRAVLESEGIDGADRYSFGGLSIVEIARRAEDGEARAKEWADRLTLLQSGGGSLRYSTRPPGAAPEQPEMVECLVTPIHGADGALDSILLQVEDHTQQRRVAERLRESEERFRALAETLPQMVWVADAEYTVTYFAPQWEQFTGRSQEELLGHGYRDLIHPDDHAQIHAQRDREGEVKAAVFRLRRHDGEYRWMEAEYRCVYAEDGSVLRWVGGTTDATDRLDGEAASRELQEQLRVALSVTGMGRYALYFREDRITADNQLSAILGVDVPALTQAEGLEGVFALVHVDDGGYVRSAVQTAAAGGPDFDVEYRLWRPTDGDGEPELRWVAARGRVEFDAEGAVRMVGVIEDITQRRIEEEERLHWQKREAIGTLAGGIAHDFNNVISAILSNASLAESELELGVSPSTSIGEISRGAERAADLVRRLLAFSREESEAAPVRAPFDLGAVVEEACGLVTSTLPPGAQLRRDIASGLPPVLGSSAEIHRVLVNLLANAGHAVDGRAGTVSVTVDAPDDRSERRPGDTGPRMIRIRVEDTGPGIPSSALDRIFDPFFTTRPAGKGTGLGLASARTIVRDHGGAITAENMPAGGARFTVLLPAHRTAPNAGESIAEAVSPADAAGAHDAPRRATARVIFVEDEAPLVRLAERALPSHGYAVRAFTNPTEALAAITAAPTSVDALITDLSMPELSGLDLIEQVRALRPDLPVVLSSGFLTTANRKQAELQGVDAIISKPCSIADLVGALERMVEPAPVDAS